MSHRTPLRLESALDDEVSTSGYLCAHSGRRRTSYRHPAVVTTFVFSAVYYAATGIFFFSDLHVPIAVFLGMHLLFTDPATSPRTELGRIFYGVLYGRWYRVSVTWHT